MNLTRCAQGHFYDGEKFSSCPHCAGGGNIDSPTEMFDAAAEGIITEAAPNPQTPVAPVSTVDYQTDDTLPLGGIPVDSPTVQLEESESDNTVPWPGVESNANTNPVAEDDDDDHTVGFFDQYDAEMFTAGTTAATQTSAPKATNSNQQSSPCVGWLVAIGGNHIGQDFHLKVGKNFIGRGEDMDIALVGDRSVSREKQAIVIYEPKQHLYLVQPGEASSLVYCNNEVVLNPVALKAYDMITVGEVNLLFVPLCGENFNWNDILLHKKES